FQAEDGIRDRNVTGVQTCALPIYLENKLADPLTTLMLFCNPHNPTGIVWSRSEVERIAALCQKYHVVLLSDEIHGDIVRNNVKYTPAFSVTQELKNNVISLVSPSKTFNVAALHAAKIGRAHV